MVNGSWFMAHGSRLMPQDSWLKAHGQEKIGASAQGEDGPGANFFLAMSREPRALRHEP